MTSRRYLAALTGLLLIVAFAWCASTGRWTKAAWGTPLQYQDAYYSDMIITLAGMKATAEGHNLPLAWKTVPELGAPYDGNWNDWPSIEEIPTLLIGVLGKWLGPFTGLNVALLAGHLLAAATLFLVARSEGCATRWAFTGGLAYGLAPFFFAQSPHHLTTAYAWHIPLFLPVWKWAATEPGLTFGTTRFRQALAISFLTGLQNVYYTNIFCQIMLLAAGVRTIRTRSTAPLKAAVAIIGMAATAFVVMNLDTWTFKAVYGPNSGALVREYKWLEIYGLKLVDLVVPPATHHSRIFADFAAAHRSAAPLQDEGSYLGLAGVAALALLVATTAADVIRRPAKAIPMEAWQVLWIVLCFSTGGLNTILGAFGFTLFRTGCRYSIVILAIVLLYAAKWLTASDLRHVVERETTTMGAASQSRASNFSIFVAILACAVILWDQVPRTPTAEETATIARQVAADRDFTEKMEAALPPGAMVFQMPVMEFPESPLPGMPSYDHFRPYLFSKKLRYSFGSMKGRERERWQPAVQGKFFEGATPDRQAGVIRLNQANARVAVDELKRLGFSALYVNRNAFADRGKGIEATLLDLGYKKPPIQSAAGDLLCIVLDKEATGTGGETP